MPTPEQLAEFERLSKLIRTSEQAIKIDPSGNPILVGVSGQCEQSVPVPTHSFDSAQEIVRVKELRRDIDTQIQRVKTLKPSRERSLVITKLQEAVMWLGMDLKRINDENPGASPNPYPDSKDPSNTRIQPTSEGLKL